ncbi:uncharacterized protein LOC128999079 [Macrosteles quadrilineatus]|uniref:uncharacterized protein LOC128999079 n=1 Tax=Macrosteles quadrilineatus TaxID=74068 RepID=UPI0023E13ABD|nr:uncharacterized protein LOC128999079 [Macrosteles quadrilineatus]
MVVGSPLRKIQSLPDLQKISKGPGRPKKIKRGRPKVLDTTREEQLKDAKKRYSDKNLDKNREDAKRYRDNNPDRCSDSARRYSIDHPDVHRDAVKRYNVNHPEVHRGAVQRYDSNNPEVHREAVRRYNDNNPEVHRVAVRDYDLRNPEAARERIQIFRLKNPTLLELRHLPLSLARSIYKNGPMGGWKEEQINEILPYRLKNTSLWNDNVFLCPHCGARLFEEEKSRRKWCCGEGAYNIISLPPLQCPFYDDQRFLQRARAYNDMFAFCALEVSGGYRHPSGLSFFKIEGRLYHQVYNINAPGQKFTTSSGIVQFVNRSRLYLDDGEERRNIAMGRSLDCEVIQNINDFLTHENPFVEHYRQLSNEPSVSAHLDFELTNRSSHGPALGDKQTGIEVHAVLSTDENPNDPRKLTIWKVGSPRPTSIDLLSPLMEPLQYPLLYPQGTLGWHIGALDNEGQKLSQLKYTRCLLLSEVRFSHLGRLSQAWQVDVFARYEEEKLRFLKFCQMKNTANATRVGPLDEILDAQPGRQVLNEINNDETIIGEGGVLPGKVYLPKSFTGGPRYMKVQYENSMALVSRLGFPTFFLTFTYSATWEENKKACPRGSGRSDPSTACRIFQIKLLELLRDLRSGAMFGRAIYIVYVIEMQMRGLPHAHIVFKIDGSGPVQAADIDALIRADIPSEDEADGRLRGLVLRHMVHGPCGPNHRTDFPCWDSVNNHCTKYFPKPHCPTSHVDERGFVVYKRDHSNEGIVKSRNRDITVHDGWVVPYNPALLLKYEAHINLEVASTRRVIKYLFKYLMKGGSLQNVTVTPLSKQDDEIETYVTKRMVGASDACWRLLEFPISKMEPTVDCLPVHLEGKQNIYFRPTELSNVTGNQSSMLITYFDRPLDPIFDDITYQSFYEKFVVQTRRPTNTQATVYNHPNGTHFITPRQRGEKVCRLFWVSPNRTEQYYLRLILMVLPCRGYSDILSRGGPECTSFQQVARKLGLVEDEDEYSCALREASSFMVASRLRSFFVLLCNMGAPASVLWDAFRSSLCEDYLERTPSNPGMAEKLALIEIDRSLRRQGSSLIDHGLPDVQDHTTELGRESLIYDVHQQREYVDLWEPRLSADQKRVYDYVNSLLCESATSESSMIFIDGPGGYGKTLLLSVILAHVRSCNHVALAVASSGIAAQNMAGGTTAHSMFKLPLDLGDGSGFWNITNGTQRAELIRASRLIVFDEAPMAHRFIFEILDRSLRDLMKSNVQFGGKVILCSGDFRQIAPVVARARTPRDIASVSLRASYLWPHFKVFSLTTPQRTIGCSEYSEFLLRVGDGTVNSFTGKNCDGCSLIPLPNVRYVTSLDQLIDFVFPKSDLIDPDLVARRSILSTINVNVKEVNEIVLDSLGGRLYELRSADSVDVEADDGMDVDVQLLNKATGKGVPDHVLRLKVGSVCLVMRNLNIADGLVNGTKVIVTHITNFLITVRLPGKREPICIPRIQFMFPFVEGSPLRVRRRQFPLMLAYAITGHKSQGQTIDRVGVDLRTDCFTHGQLYVLLSRVRNPDDILLLVQPQRVIDGAAYAMNIAYDELLL